MSAWGRLGETEQAKRIPVDGASSGEWQKAVKSGKQVDITAFRESDTS